MIKIRMSRGGRIARPIYTIVATNSRSPRDSKYLEKLGQYDPKASPELKNVKTDALKAWLSKGAHMSDTVKSLLKRNNISLD